MKWVVLAALVVAFGALGCQQATRAIDMTGLTGPRLTDEEQIAVILNEVHRGMEEQRIFRVLAHVSKSYEDQEGRDYEGIQQYLRELFRDYRDIRITRPRPRIMVQGRRARVVETFGTEARPRNPDADRPINMHGQVIVYFEKTGDTWQIIEWGPLQ